VRARFTVARYPAGKTQGPTVVREPSYPTSLSAESPMLKSVCRLFSLEVLAPVWRHLKSYPRLDDDTRAFVENLPALVRTGSLEAPTSPRLPSTSRFTIDEG
jgi:hypothetical protein